MTKKITVVLLLLLSLSVYANDENLLKNGDFEKKKSRWKGDGKAVVKEFDNHSLEMKVRDNRDSVIEQDIDCEGMKELVITFKYRVTEDFDGTGITLRFRRKDDNTYTYWSFDPKKSTKPDQWHNYRWTFNEILGNDEMTFSIEVKEGHEGTGLAYFDEVSVRELK